ncbi:hypothetical protein I6B53_04605 [Schaalia sp. 19OD2882]|uniref:hypothetical protein n=1 Tax=Schaalia sp. 19OD2882 TaxID=2794089 RepID=UPI001C1EB748|nr:hypothetical protein [Schaalia sp. 19OD2882]QWW20368.1 hypothetical protein I6B53_04605 [Schaalia sp. 19OD2882]
MARHFRAFLALTAAASLGLAACSAGDLVAQSGDTIPQSGPTIDADRASHVLKDLESVVASADATNDTTLLASRLADPALRMRKAQYALAKAGGPDVPRINATPDTLSVSDSATWPRAILNVTTQDGIALPVVEMLVQSDARSPYKLHSWTRMLGGTEVTLPNVAKGSKTLSDDSNGFVKTPREAVAAYVEMLNSGKAGNDVFTADEFSTKILSDTAKVDESAKAAGSVTFQAAENTDPLVGVTLEDGAALVSAPLVYTVTYNRTIAKSTMTLAGMPKVLNPGDEDKVEGKAVVTFAGAVLLKIPPATQPGSISVVGAEQVIQGVTLDPSTNPDNAG